MGDFIATTVLEFDDRYEGQVLHRGTEKDCERTRDLIPAIACSGEMPVRSWIAVSPVGPQELNAGERWREMKDVTEPKP